MIGDHSAVAERDEIRAAEQRNDYVGVTALRSYA
jgi:hypothetical protein